MAKVFDKIVRKQRILLQGIQERVFWMSKKHIGYGCCDISELYTITPLVRSAKESNSICGTANGAVGFVEFRAYQSIR